MQTHQEDIYEYYNLVSIKYTKKNEVLYVYRYISDLFLCSEFCL